MVPTFLQFLEAQLAGTNDPMTVLTQYINAIKAKMDTSTPQQIQQMIEVNARALEKMFKGVTVNGLSGPVNIADMFRQRAAHALQQHGGMAANMNQQAQQPQPAIPQAIPMGPAPQGANLPVAKIIPTPNRKVS